MSKIYISVSGGCIQGVWSTNKKDQVEIWDWDNIEAEYEYTGNLEKEFKEIIRGMHNIAQENL